MRALATLWLVLTIGAVTVSAQQSVQLNNVGGQYFVLKAPVGPAPSTVNDYILSIYAGIVPTSVAPLSPNTVIIADANGQLLSATLTNGQLLIGSTGGAPTPATLTAGAGISILNAPGAITIASTYAAVSAGTVNNTTLRWNAGTSAWVENLNVTATAAGTVTAVNSNVTSDLDVDGNTTLGDNAAGDVIGITGVTTMTGAANINTTGAAGTTLGSATSTSTVAGPLTLSGLSNVNTAQVVGLNGTTAGTTTITAGTNISVTPAAGTITIATTSADVDNGTVNNTTLRWNAATNTWVENLNVTATAAGTVTAVNSNVTSNLDVDGNTTLGDNAGDVIGITGVTGITGATTVTGATNINTTGVAGTTLGSATSTSTVAGPLTLSGLSNVNTAQVVGLNGTTAGTTTITAGTNISVTPAAGTITIATTSADVDNGTVNNSTLRWDAGTSTWVENTNVKSASTGDVTITNSLGLATVSPNATLHVNGSMAVGLRVVAASTAASATDYCIVVDGNAAVATVTLPAPSASTSGRVLVIKRGFASVGSVSVTTPSGTIDGLASYLLPAVNGRITVVCDGTDWRVLASN